MRLLVFLVVLVLGLLAVQEVAAKDPCSKDWLRFMVVNACGMDKRHLDRRKPAAAPSLLEILDEVDEELEHWRLDHEIPTDGVDKDEQVLTASTKAAPWRLPVNDTEAETKDKPKKAGDSKGGFITRLFEHPGQVMTDAWMGLVGVEPKAPRRRAIQNMISRCCAEDCSEDAFEGVCD